MILEAEVESLQSGSHVTTIIQNFTLVNLTSTATLYLAELLFGSYSSFLSYALDHLLNFSLSTQLDSISGCGNYLYYAYLLRNKVIISQASLDGVESKQLVGHNRVHSSLVQMSATSSVFIRVTC